MKTCGVTDCDRPFYAKGWCKRHYGRWRKTGDPLKERPPYPKRTDFESLRSRSTVSETGCWEWGGQLNARGYGRVGYQNKRWLAHRLSYTFAKGPIPEGMTVDHTCFNPGCINPGHLRLLSLSDNSRLQRKTFKTHCKRGHEFTPENTLFVGPHRTARSCRTCAAIRMAEFINRRAAS